MGKLNLSKKQMLEKIDLAFKEKQFFVVFQPQYNHSNGLLVGAEALVRWKLPDGDIVPPIEFIPFLEENNLISQLDLYVFEETCRFQADCIKNKYHLVPISCNLSRVDMLQDDLLDKIAAIAKKYKVPSKILPLELTESAAAGDIKKVQEFINRVHEFGFKLEMDDFGSGYSSLNVLKDVDFDLIKLDLQFLQGNLTDGKAGIIVKTIVKMGQWLGMPIIAEGVETKEQADFMLSLGCEYMQGYLYSKPIFEEDFINILNGGEICKIIPPLKLIETLNAGKFWSPESLDTLIFSNYTSGAIIFEYKNGKTEVLRVNQKYLKELGMNLTEKDIVNSDIISYVSEADRDIFIKMLEDAKSTEAEQESEGWWLLKSACCGEEKLCIRSEVKMIGKSSESVLFYGTIRNITAEKKRYSEILDSERRFKMASEQVNIYYWEYTVATKEMRPCFRCMRDLGLPALVTNYPEPAIEMGIFPPEVADMYREWHKKIAEGVPHLEAVIPLTVGRVPFLVRYTTEFDSAGRPVKAYGSAALVVDNK